MHFEIPSMAVLVLSGLACAFDIRIRRIPNLLTFGGAALALVVVTATHGLGGLVSSASGWGVGVALFLPFFLLGGMGAGDVKLLGCLGAWLGPQAAAWLAIYTAMAGGVMALSVGLATGYAPQAFRNLWALFAYWRVVGVRPLAELTLAGSKAPRLPYALPIAVGALATLWWQ